MKILIVGQVFYPDNFRINDIVKELSKVNEVKVITGLPDYDFGKIPIEYRFFRKRKEKYFGAEIVRVPTIARRKGPIFRSLNYISFVITGSVYAFCLKNKYDVVFSFQTSPITMFIPGLVYAKKNKVKSILYTLDLWPESVKAMNIREGTFVFRMIHCISKLIYKGADRILTSSPSFRDYLVTVIGLNESKISNLPQYTDEEDLSVEMIWEKPSNPISFTFAGNIGLVQDIETIVKAANLIKDSDFTINIVGSGSNLKNIESMVDKFKIGRHFVFHGRKSYEEMNRIYVNTDVCLLTLKDEGYIGKTIPGKLQTYMAKGKTILGAISNDAKTIIEMSNAGLCVESGDYKSLSEKMLYFIKNPSVIHDYNSNSYEYYKNNFTREKFIDKLNKYLKGDESICLKEKNCLLQEEQDHSGTQFSKDSLIQTLKK